MLNVAARRGAALGIATWSTAEITACLLLGVSPDNTAGMPTPRPLHALRVSMDALRGHAELVWTISSNDAVATGIVRPTDAHTLSWELSIDGRQESATSTNERPAIATTLNTWLSRFPTDPTRLTGRWRVIRPGWDAPRWEDEPRFAPDESPGNWILDSLTEMAAVQAELDSPSGRTATRMATLAGLEADRDLEHLARKERKRAEEAERRRALIARAKEQHRQRALAARAHADRTPPRTVAPVAPVVRTAVREPPPPVPVTIHAPDTGWQETTMPLTSLAGYALRERAALWWVSNQSDDLLCLPQCRITRLEYQVRAALRVLGALRGRALLSDEVGLGKTIEAGLVIKELLTRGMVKRFLVLTLPSLVDQWEEELADKFGLTAVTTNQPGARSDPDRFWRESPAVVASMHTLKQPAQLAIARDVHWDLLVVDEAHHLRNRESQAWQAANVLPRQFLLLLTATPVQNSLEELYNLVTLLKPGQLPSPREFRARFLDPQRPRQPREPAELRRLLGQVMIRNTRANSGLKLPPRHAETFVFTPEENEARFWRTWEDELRGALARLPASQASLWGRLLLQAAGSSPAAWRSALEKFPDTALAATWREHAPLDASWRRKCQLLAPLARREGGVVIFTQFLATQAALATALRESGVTVFVINGATPPPERQPITEQFRQRGGALVLTHSGTEGRNLQFCHCLANFDLPWNPMEIEQRIGRLHRLGQQQPVHICNFVQAGTLQEHLLEILQEKLNLFELVVGETGLVLGDRFSGDELEEEIFRRWRDHAGRVAEAFVGLGEELAAGRATYDEVKQLDDTLFAQDFEST